MARVGGETACAMSCRALYWCARARLFGGQRQRLPQRIHSLGDQPVEHPGPAPFARQESRLGEHLETMAHRRLRQTDGLDEVADARLGARLAGDEAEESEASWIGDRLEGGGQRIGVVLPKASAQDRRTTPYGLVLHRHERILTYIDGMCKGIDIHR